jgi:hypothetical protein
MNRTLVLGVGVAVIAASAVLVAVNVQGGDDLPANHVRTLGPAEQYRHVALPAAEPPEGALVQVHSAADPVVDGEQIAFQYSGYTISLCTRSTTRSARAACDPQPGEGSSVLRRFKDGDYVTTIRAYGKTPIGAAGAAADAVSLFTTADLTQSPSWLAEYAKRNNERIAG